MPDKTYVIAKPIEGISLNGYEYLLDSKDDVKVFNSYQDAHDFVSEAITDQEPDEFIRATDDCPDLNYIIS